MGSLGVSVYPDLRPLDEIADYLQRAAQAGCKRVFSSMFSVEGTNEEIIDYFVRFNKAVHDCGMEVALDVNTVFLARLGCAPDNVDLFAEIGCDTIRMDGSFGQEGDLVLCRNPHGIKVELNASAGALKELDYLASNGVGPDVLSLGHNFYPQRWTGLKWSTFVETNTKLAAYGYPLEAFVSSQAPGTHGVWDAREGLPTVERLRDYPADLQARIMLATPGVTNITFGNAYATDEELAAVAAVYEPARRVEDSPAYEALCSWGIAPAQPEREIMLKVVPDPDITDEERYMLFEMYPQADYGDSSEWIWRSRSGRLFQRADIVPRPVEGETFATGDVVMVNANYRHYMGELQVVRIPIANDGQRNRVGHLAPHEEDLLALIGDGESVRFVEA